MQPLSIFCDRTAWSETPGGCFSHANAHLSMTAVIGVSSLTTVPINDCAAKLDITWNKNVLVYSGSKDEDIFFNENRPVQYI